jgi:hypothetical protein
MLTITGILLLIKALVYGFNNQFPSGDWNSVLFTLQGILFLIMGVGNLRARRYFIECNDQEIRFLLPDTKKPETIQLGEIKSVTIRLFEIELSLKDKLKILDLRHMQFEDLKKSKKNSNTLKNLKPIKNILVPTLLSNGEERAI